VPPQNSYIFGKVPPQNKHLVRKCYH